VKTIHSALATAQGHTVFIVSWVNPDATFARKTLDDYLLEGPLAALDAIETQLANAQSM
jgi:polyhydroxyalkanoate synthase